MLIPFFKGINESTLLANQDQELYSNIIRLGKSTEFCIPVLHI